VVHDVFVELELVHDNIFCVPVISLFESLHQHEHLIEVGERSGNCAVLIPNDKWCRMVVDSDFWVRVSILLRDEPPQIV
jgi:hypothetical protein